MKGLLTFSAVAFSAVLILFVQERVAQPPPSIVAMSTDPAESVKVYDDWAWNYETHIRQWGYDMPERAAELLKQYAPNTKTILDLGAGDGLLGVALRQAGFEDTTMVGTDISSEMLKVANHRGCYDDTRLVNLNEPLPFETDSFDAVTCIGTMTYVDPEARTLEEFVRVTKKGGYICYTNRTDKLKDWEGQEKRLEAEGKWEPVAKIGPVPYLPKNPEYGDKVQAVLYLYRVL